MKFLSIPYKKINKKENEGKKVDIINLSDSCFVILFSFKKEDTKIALYGNPPRIEAMMQLIP